MSTKVDPFLFFSRLLPLYDGNNIIACRSYLRVTTVNISNYIKVFAITIRSRH